MPVCPRCGRYHKGLCGIPAGVTKGFGTRSVRSAAVAQAKGFASHKPGTRTLTQVLSWGQREREKVVEMMKLVPPGMEEYDMLQERLEHLDRTIDQVRQQLGAREG